MKRYSSIFKFFGILSVIFGLGLLFISIFIGQNYNIQKESLSELVTHSRSRLTFNLSVCISALFFIFYIFSLSRKFKNYKISPIILIATMIAGFLIGLYPVDNFPNEHKYLAIAYFTLYPIGIITFGLESLPISRKLAFYSMTTGSVSTILILGLKPLFTGFGIPELAYILTHDFWIVLTSLYFIINENKLTLKS